MVPKSHFRHSISGIALVLGITIVLFLAGCGTAAQGAFLQPTNTAAPGATASPSTPSPGATATPSATAFAELTPQPSGTADLTWDPGNNNTLTATVSLIGLAPANPASYTSSPYPATISSGSCQQPGNTVHQLTAISADQLGAGTSTTTIKGVTGGIPARGWYIDIHAPASANQAASLACANILNPNASTTAKQTVTTHLHGMPAANGKHGTFGRARLTLSGTTLTVDLTMVGLAPGSKHDAHIHVGSCAQQGAVAHPLDTITADSSGRAHVVTTIKGVQAIPGNWYVHVHNSTDLTTQAGYQPIACGNVYARTSPGK
jgi:hypothetical protein